MKTYSKLFEQIISLENLFLSWDEFKRGKRSKKDVQEFEFSLEENIFSLHRDLKNKTYEHDSYENFYVCDPKVRHIHKATVRDRIVHHAVFRIVGPIFEPTFISRSFSCRIGKGTHKGVDALEGMIRSESKNFTGQCWALKCDISKFFDSVDHNILCSILAQRIKDHDALDLIKEIIYGFSTGHIGLLARRGVPIGNLTSQLFANIYMNEFDQFVKHELKIKNYVRYTDDFVVVSADRKLLEQALKAVEGFLSTNLHLALHPHKVEIRKVRQGIDFLGYVILPHHRRLRTKTKRRMMRKMQGKVVECNDGNISDTAFEQTLTSYLGVLTHADTHNLEEKIMNDTWFLKK